MSFFSRLTILCAILRHLQMLFTLFMTGELTSLRPRALIVDQLSAGLPFLTYMCPASPILFYCHFPDLLLAQGREASALKRLYRVPFDKLEEWSMGFATSVAVNSEFTKSVVAKTWPRLSKATNMRVVYPCVDIGGKEKELRKNAEKVLDGEKVILSINRFERKKDIDLAIRAFAAVPEKQRKNVRLVIAGTSTCPFHPFFKTNAPSGGHDPRIEENVQYLTHLQNLATSLSLPSTTIPSSESILSSPPASASPILFLPSVPNPTKASLLRAARLLVYTPAAEHFGIVPLEAMRARVPVLAATTGGPVESVQDGKTGWLRDTTKIEQWTEVMEQALGMTENEVRAMGEAGAHRVREVFGREKMAERLDEIAEEMKRGKQKGSFALNTVISAVLIGFAFVVGLLCAKGFYIAKQRVLKAWAESPLW